MQCEQLELIHGVQLFQILSSHPQVLETHDLK